GRRHGGRGVDLGERRRPAFVDVVHGGDGDVDHAGLAHRLQAERVGPGDQPRAHDPDAQHRLQTTLPLVEGDELLAAGDRNPAAPPVPSGVVLTEVVDEPGRQAYADVTAEAYVDAFLPADIVHVQLARLEALRGPSVRAVVARDGGRPVSAALVLASGSVASV